MIVPVLVGRNDDNVIEFLTGTFNSDNLEK
jgi:hypothetical protein